MGQTPTDKAVVSANVDDSSSETSSSQMIREDRGPITSEMEGPVSNPAEIQTQIDTENTTSQNRILVEDPVHGFAYGESGDGAGSRQHTQVDDPYVVEIQLDGETGMDLYAGTSLEAINAILKHECEIGRVCVSIESEGTSFLGT